MNAELESPPFSRAIAPMVIGWLIPGAGHLLLKRPIRAAIYAAVVLPLFAFGLAIGGQFFIVEPHSPLSLLAVFVHYGTGLPFLLVKLFAPNLGLALTATTEAGTTYLLTAGIMNLLLVLDAHDIARARKS